MTIPWQVVHATPQDETTKLLPSQEQAFQDWLKRNKVTDLDAPDSYYDYRGAYLAGINRSKNGHWPDTFKQHGHPTFSVESQYAMPNDPEAGTWKGDTYTPNPNLSQVKALRTLLQMFQQAPR